MRAVEGFAVVELVGACGLDALMRFFEVVRRVGRYTAIRQCTVKHVLRVCVGELQVVRDGRCFLELDSLSIDRLDGILKVVRGIGVITGTSKARSLVRSRAVVSGRTVEAARLERWRHGVGVAVILPLVTVPAGAVVGIHAVVRERTVVIARPAVWVHLDDVRSDVCLLQLAHLLGICELWQDVLDIR